MVDIDTFPRLYKLKRGFARRNNLLVHFAAVPLAETQKAVYLYGHGTTETATTGVCSCCGRPLKHPVSVTLGIGPICGGHFHDWDTIGGYTPENIERLKTALTEVIIDGWIPKSQIIEAPPADTKIDVPATHAMLNRKSKDKLNMSATLARNKYGEEVVRVQFDYDDDLIEKIRALPGRFWHRDDKCWSVPPYDSTLHKLKAWGFTLDANLTARLVAAEATTQRVDTHDFGGLAGKLYKFQRDGVAFIERNEGRALIADEMGLGKTVQALAWLQLHPELRPVVIVVPASLKLNWARETEKWVTNPTVEVLQGIQPYKPTGDIIVINYDILHAWVDTLIALSPKVLVTDECHYYKNSKANRTRAVKQLGKHVPHIIALSGTPIVNRPIEAYNAVRLIAPALFPSQKYYIERYCGARMTPFGLDVRGATHTQELHQRLTDTIMLRRLKKDVLTDLPDKTRAYVPMELDNITEYMTAERDLIAYLRATRGEQAARSAMMAEALTKIEVLKQIVIRGKMNQVTSWIDDFIETDQKLVVFAVHRSVVNALFDRYGDIAVKIDGSVSTKQRDAAVQAFQNDPDVRLFIGNIKAAGVGLTLTAASNIAFLELPWTPGDLAQAEDRCHRISQTNAVTIWLLLAAGTIEERIANLLDDKRRVLDAVLDGRATDQESLLISLIKQYTNESTTN